MGNLLLLCLFPTLSTGSPSGWPGNMSIGEARRMHLSLHVWPNTGSSTLHFGAPVRSVSGGVPDAQGLTGEYIAQPPWAGGTGKLAVEKVLLGSPLPAAKG